MNKNQEKPQKSETKTTEAPKKQTKAKTITRAEIREAKAKKKAEQKTQQKAEKPARVKKGRIRILPIWLRLYIILTLIGASLFLGMMVGYGTIGGQDPFEVFKLETWYHIVDLMKGVED